MNRKDIKIQNRLERIGQEAYSNEGCLMKIVEYEDYHNIIVEFQDEYKFRQHTGYNCFKSGEVKNPYFKSVLGVACIGNATVAVNRKAIQQYYEWRGMIRRCYDENSRHNNKCYTDCTVCDEWLCYENFKKWYDENFYQIDEEKMCLDKDILLKGNKIYSPNTCIFVPIRINSLFTKGNARRGNYPIGVSKRNSSRYKTEKYSSVCSIINGTSKHLGYFDTPEEAFYCYKEFKENYIKQVADEYKDKIPQKLYEAMYNYTVDIND